MNKSRLIAVAAMLSLNMAAQNKIDVFKAADNPLPVAVSVPFAQGEVKLADKFNIKYDGRLMPLQTSVLSKWSDGSVKWAQAIMPPMSGTVNVITNDPQQNPEVKNPVSIIVRKGRYIMSNQSTVVAFKPGTDDVLYKSQGSEFSFILSETVAEAGKTLKVKIESIEILEKGPLKATLRLRGWLAPDGKSGLRTIEILLSLYSGSPVLEVRHVIGFSFEDPAVGHMVEMIDTTSVSVPFKLTNNNNPATVELRGKSGMKMFPGDAVTQWEPDSFELTKGKSSKTYQAQLNGVVTVPVDGGREFMLSAVELPEQFPAGIARTEQGLTLNLFPEIIPKNRYTNRKTEHIHYFYLHTGKYVTRQGMEKEHCFYVGIVDKASKIAKNAVALQTRTVAMPELDYLNRTKTWSIALHKPDRVSKQWDDIFLTGAKNYFKLQKDERWYGILNWGDWFGERKVNWGNQEYDTIFIDQALRFRNPDLLREGIRGAKHLIDVDIISSHADIDRVGAVWNHALGHTGGYYLKGYVKSKTPTIFHYGRNTPGHTRLRGIATAYSLTGDIRLLEHGKSAADFLMKDDMFRERNWLPGMTAREPGWLLFCLCAVYRATGDEKYLDAANDVGNIILRQAAGRGVRHTLLPNPKVNAPPRPADKMKDYPKLYYNSPNLGALSFPLAYQSAGMIELYKLTGRKDVKANLIECSKYVKRRLYDPKKKGFKHSPCPWRPQSTKLGGVAPNALRYVLAFEYSVTGDKQTRKIIEGNLAEMFRKKQWYGLKRESLPDAPNPKSFTASLYFLPHTMELLRNTGICK